MSEMVERVAAALWRRENPDLGSYDPNSQEWHSFLGRATTAIEAMREPTDAMENAAYEGKGHGDYLEAASTWRAMLDEALK